MKTEETVTTVRGNVKYGNSNTIALNPTREVQHYVQYDFFIMFFRF